MSAAVSPCSSYFSPDGSTIQFQKLKTDLIGKIEEIYQRVQASTESSSEFILQRTKNRLLESVAEIEVDGKRIFENDGQCLGFCKWMAALFLNTKKKYPKTPTGPLLKEIAKEFAEGVGIQGAILQRIQGMDCSLKLAHDEMNIDCQEIALWDFGIKGLLPYPKDCKNHSQEILQNIFALSDGVYSLIFSGYSADRKRDKELNVNAHEALVVVEEGDCYFVDPNAGLIGVTKDLKGEKRAICEAMIVKTIGFYSPRERERSECLKGLKKLTQGLSPNLARITKETVEACIGNEGFFLLERYLP